MECVYNIERQDSVPDTTRDKEKERKRNRDRDRERKRKRQREQKELNIYGDLPSVVSDSVFLPFPVGS